MRRTIYRKEAREIIDEYLAGDSDQEIANHHALTLDQLERVYSRYSKGGVDTFTEEKKKVSRIESKSNSFLRMSL